MDTSCPTNPVRIMIVDDHPNTASMLARVLSTVSTHVEILTASNGEDAINKIGNQVMDILVTDFMMPGMNGLELIERLSGEQKPAHTILITAYDTPGLAITARRLHVQDYLVKPVQPEKIRSIISRVIEEMHPLNSRLSEDTSKRSFKILVADDYSDNLRLLSTRLNNEGYTFIPAWDGEETLQKAREENPDLVLLDVNMPKKDGFQVLAELRADPNISHIPVIMITAARISPKDIREGLILGADDYIVKPYDWRELAARIQAKLRVKIAEDELRCRTRELEHEQRRLLAVLQSTSDAVLIMDSQLRVIQTNPAGEKVFQGVESKVGQPLPSNQGYDDLIEFLNQVHYSGNHQSSEITWHDGRTFVVTATPFEEGGQVVVMHDVQNSTVAGEWISRSNQCNNSIGDSDARSRSLSSN